MPSTMSNNIKMQYSFVILIYYIELRVTYNIFFSFFGKSNRFIYIILNQIPLVSLSVKLYEFKMKDSL